MCLLDGVKKVKHLEYMYDKYDVLIRKAVPVYEKMNEMILKNINFNRKLKLNILDLGVGAGYLAFRLMKKFPNSFLEGVDYEEKMINKSRKRMSQLTSKFELFNQNIKDFKFNRKYDIVVSVLAIHHLTDSEKKKLFIKIFNNMDKGGIFVIGDAYHLAPESKNKEMLGWWENHLKKAFGEKEGRQFFKDTLKHDIYSKMANQLTWLKKAGFSGPSVVLEKYNYAVLVARK